MSQKLIMVDPGHGFSHEGNGTGAYGKVVIDGKTVTLSEAAVIWDPEDASHGLAQRLRHTLRVAGMKSEFTKPNELDISISERLRHIHAAKPHAVISLHCNSGSKTASGFEVFYDVRSPKSKDLAKHIETALIAAVGKKLPSRGIKTDQQSHIGQLGMTMPDLPSVLVEAAFVSSVHDAKLLLDRQFRKDFTDAIAKGTTAYFG